MDKLPVTTLPTGFSLANEPAFRHKLAQFVANGPANLHLIFDFDRTLTINHHKTQKEVTSWHILHEHLPPEGKRQYMELFNKYRVLELDGTMTPRDAQDWWSAILNLYAKYRLNMINVEREFLANASMRPHTAELFAFCKQHNIPTVIMSAGTRDVIQLWAKGYKIQPSLVLSTALILDAAGCITGWHKDTLIHMLNKHEVGHPELATIRKNRPNVIVVGDSMGDADMAAGQTNVLRFRVFDPRPDEQSGLDAIRQQTFTRFDAMLESGDFAPLLKILHTLVS